MFFASFGARLLVRSMAGRIQGQVGGRIMGVLHLRNEAASRQERVTGYIRKNWWMVQEGVSTAQQSVGSFYGSFGARARLKENHFPAIQCGMLAEVNSALADVVEEVRADAERRAPVRYGDYRRSIKGRVEGGRGFVFTTDFRANWLENGRRRAPAFPHLVPAAEAARSSYTARMRKALQAGAHRGGR